MKLFVRNVNKNVNMVEAYAGSTCVDFLDLSGFDHAEIYKVEVSIDKKNDFSLYPTVANALFNNIRTDQSIIVNGSSIAIPAGFYNLQELMSLINSKGAVISLITSESDAYHCKLSSQVDFTNASELKEILGFDSNVSNGISNHCVDITRGLNVLQVYSNIVCSDNDTPVCTIKIDDPTKDFHDTLFTNVSVTCCPINYIDFIIRDIHGEYVELNADNININFFIRAYEEFDNLTEKTVETSFNITTSIDKLKDGKYTKQLDHSFNLTNGKIVNANFLLDGEINNLSTDQTITLDDVSYTIPAGCYSLQELLARLNALSSAVFSYISSGEDCYKLTITGVEKISCDVELANMLGLESVSKGEEVETVRYQLTVEANMFVYKNSNASYIIPIGTGIYTEKVFFKKLEDAIRPYQNDISIVDKGNYWELNHGEIYVASGNYVGRCFSRYYYSSGIKHRKEEDVSIIPKAGYFYFDENITTSHCLEYFDIINYQDRQEFTLTANITDTSGNQIVQKKFNLSQYIGHNNSTSFLRTFYNEVLIDYCKQYSWVYKSHAYFQTIDTTHRIAFTGSPTFIQAFHLPTTPARSFDMYCDNMYHKGANFDFEDLTLYYQMEGSDEVVDLLTNNNFDDYVLKMRECRSRINKYIYEGLGLSSANYYLYYETPFGCNFVPNAIMTTNNVKGRFFGTAIDKGVIKGLHTDYNRKTCNIYFDFTALNTHRLNLGYTNMEGVKAGLQQFYKEKEYSDTVLPSLTFEVSDNAVIARNEKSLIKYSFDSDTSMKYLFFQDSSRKRDIFGDRMEFYKPYANIEVNNDNYQIIITKPNGNNQIINIPLGWYTYENLFEKFNSYLEYPFSYEDTYWLLNYCPNQLDYNLEIDFLMMSSEVRVYYPNHKIYKHKFIYSDIPINITNNFENLVIYCNFIKGNNSYEKVYLTNFRIENQNGKTFLRTEQLNIPLHKGSIDYIEYILLNTDNKPFTFAGNLYISSEIVNGKIKAGTLEFL